MTDRPAMPERLEYDAKLALLVEIDGGMPLAGATGHVTDEVMRELARRWNAHAEQVDAIRAAHSAMDTLFARLITACDTFYPTKSPEWAPLRRMNDRQP